jgi:threonine/homoserine/homoserine lactone efflux protein
MPQFVNRNESYLPQISILIAIFVLTGLLVQLTYSYLAASCVRYLKGERLSFVLNKVSGLLFWLISGMVLLNFCKKLSF